MYICHDPYSYVQKDSQVHAGMCILKCYICMLTYYILKYFICILKYYVCICIPYICIKIHTYIYTHTHTAMYRRIHRCMQACVYLNTIYVYSSIIYTHTYSYVQKDSQVHAGMWLTIHDPTKPGIVFSY